MSRFGKIGTQYFDDAGDPLISGKLHFYESGTTTGKDTFADVNLTVLNANPVELTAAGRQPDIFFDGVARVVLTKSDTTQVEVRDPSGDTGIIGGIPTWNAVTVYGSGDTVVGPDGNFYISIFSGNQANDPTTTPAAWTQIRFIRVWNTNETYGIGQVAEGSDFALYSSLTNSNLGNDPLIDVTNWKGVLPADVIATGDVVLDTNDTSTLKVTDTVGARIDVIRLDASDDLRIGDSSGVDFLQIDSLFDQKFNIAGSEGFRVTGTGSKTTGIHEVTSGVKFPATQVPSADPNTIDDYEEGTFTPAVTADAGSGQTYTVQVGLYTKAGRHFSCTGRLALASNGTLSGDMRLTGLPAASNSTTDAHNALYVGFAAGMAIAVGGQVSGYNNPATTSVVLRLNDTTTGGSNLQASEFGGTGQIMFGINYNE